jgi:hypothetical protein
MPVKRRRPRSTRIAKFRTLARSPLSRADVTRAEYNHIIDILNERSEILNALREGLEALRHDSDIQLQRIAQLQADLDEMRRASTKTRLA